MFHADDIPSPLYTAVLRVLRGSEGETTTEVGLRAWWLLPVEQRLEELPNALGAYVARVADEERSRQMDEVAVDRTHTYLDGHDMAMAWDAALADPDQHDEIPVDRQALINILCEVELLQHRLAMRERQVAE